MMAETPSKRQREENFIAEESEQDPKRHKTYNDILSILEEIEEDEPNNQLEEEEDFSSILTTLQRELSSDYSSNDLFSLPSSGSADPDPTTYPSSATSLSEKDETEMFMRHLLEASDDELGLPNIRSDGGGDGDGEVVINGGDAFQLGDGLWDLDDVAASANCYTLLQSDELFM